MIDRTDKTLSSQDIQNRVINIDLSQWQSIRWVKRADGIALEAKTFDKEVVYLDINTGNALPAMNADDIQKLAFQQYTGKGAVKKVSLLNAIPQEVNHLNLPLFKVSFDDWINTDFYLSLVSGEVKSVRSDLWRFYDFFWMLHIMDYEKRENFNNWLVMAAAMIALLFCVSGLALLYFTLLKPKTHKLWRKVFTKVC